MHLFKLISAGPESGDCTRPYFVNLNKPCTAQEFVDEVLTRKEWGYIGIENPNFIFGYPSCEYDKDRLKYPLPSDILKREVESAKASGGWSRMDYWLTLKEKHYETNETVNQTI